MDDCEPRHYLKAHYLVEAGFRASQAGTGKAALQSLETERPDLVLLDVNLPDMHGSEVCREVKNRWAIPVVFTSSVDIPAELHRMADGCVVSPNEPDLLAAVRAVLHHGAYPKWHQWKPGGEEHRLGLRGAVVAWRGRAVRPDGGRLTYRRPGRIRSMHSERLQMGCAPC